MNFSNIPPVTKNLIIINVLFFVATFVFSTKGISLEVFLGAFFPTSPNFNSWQLISHMFMHGGLAHIFFNMFVLWMFGTAVEQNLGQNKFLILYFVAGLGSFALFNLYNYIQINELTQTILAEGGDPDLAYEYAKRKLNGDFAHSPESMLIDVPALNEQYGQLITYLASSMVGASGAISGVLIAFAVLYPDAVLMLLFPPIPMKAKYLIPAMVLLDIYLGVANYEGDNVAHFAHVGGAIIGFLLVRHWKKNKYRYL